MGAKVWGRTRVDGRLGVERPCLAFCVFAFLIGTLDLEDAGTFDFDDCNNEHKYRMLHGGQLGKVDKECIYGDRIHM